MDFKKRVRRLEDVVGQDNLPLGVAIRNSVDGSISWDGRTFSNESAFQKAISEAFADLPISAGPKAILITFYRVKPMP